ncbi:hypothetical protein KORDIASMS9_01909 [Kordia sp. SMS9]|uniref:hypothetical protein n=1 Tax=Kordia sp. SMS9 TaxID=2282170 RepID=UPI000E0D9139|nr:hypothetical protein [Kordia sp. SMS9]AXG69682.1 hypothetical protein KORDIASMS9_01909 [Kordia sp. SMS9]
MKKKSIKNLSLNKKSISKLQPEKSMGGQGTFRCILSIIDQNGNNICITRFAATCPQTNAAGCVLTIEVDGNTYPIC